MLQQEMNKETTIELEETLEDISSFVVSIESQINTNLHFLDVSTNSFKDVEIAQYIETVVASNEDNKLVDTMCTAVSSKLAVAASEALEVNYGVESFSENYNKIKKVVIATFLKIIEKLEELGVKLVRKLTPLKTIAKNLKKKAIKYSKNNYVAKNEAFSSKSLNEKFNTAVTISKGGTLNPEVVLDTFKRTYIEHDLSVLFKNERVTKLFKTERKTLEIVFSVTDVKGIDELLDLYAEAEDMFKTVSSGFEPSSDSLNKIKESVLSSASAEFGSKAVNTVFPLSVYRDKAYSMIAKNAERVIDADVGSMITELNLTDVNDIIVDTIELDQVTPLLDTILTMNDNIDSLIKTNTKQIRKVYGKLAKLRALAIELKDIPKDTIDTETLGNIPKDIIIQIKALLKLLVTYLTMFTKLNTTLLLNSFRATLDTISYVSKSLDEYAKQ